MPEPIASSSTSSPSSCDVEDEASLGCQSPSPPTPGARAAGTNACLPPEAPVEAAVSTASAALAQKFSRNDQSAFVAASAPLDSPAAFAPPTLLVASSTAPGAGALTARGWEFAVHDAEFHGERQAIWGGVHLSASVELDSADVHLGSRNPDGSYGANVGVGRSAIEGQLTADYHGWSVTIGTSVSSGGSISSGEGRDSDGDGIPERCFQMSLGPFTLGECDEL